MHEYLKKKIILMIQEGHLYRIYIKLLHIVGISLGKKKPSVYKKTEGFLFFL